MVKLWQKTNECEKYINILDENELAHDLHEKAKRGPPTNKNISVRNIKAQIANMSANENAGFKSEYHVRISFYCINYICTLRILTQDTLPFISQTII